MAPLQLAPTDGCSQPEITSGPTFKIKQQRKKGKVCSSHRSPAGGVREKFLIWCHHKIPERKKRFTYIYKSIHNHLHSRFLYKSFQENVLHKITKTLGKQHNISTTKQLLECVSMHKLQYLCTVGNISIHYTCECIQ